MEKMGDEIHLETREARSGDTPHILRYVLAISLILCVLALSAVWITGALSTHPGHGQAVTAEEHALGGYK